MPLLAQSIWKVSKNDEYTLKQILGSLHGAAYPEEVESDEESEPILDIEQPG